MSTVVLNGYGCNYPNCPRAAAYGASERDYRVRSAADAISGVTLIQLDEAGRIDALHTPTAESSAPC